MNYWIEKTIVDGRPDRINGDRALGKALWSPQKDKRGADIYKNMRLVAENDIILHIIDNKHIVGVSRVKDKSINTTGLIGTDWEGPSYLIQLDEYISLKKNIDRNIIFQQKNRDILLDIEKDSEVFYTSTLELRQGAYLTPCPLKLLLLIDNEYRNITGDRLPMINFNDIDISIGDRNKGLIKIYIESLYRILIYKKDLVKRFIALLLTKPFVILTGLSGSGKTKLAQAFAMWICEHKKQYCLIPVGADWTSREPLLGYPNALEQGKYVKPDNGVLDLLIEANNNPANPYFLILDEMNLSHVERYFADFLSAMESKQPIPLHSNQAGMTTQDDTLIPNEIRLPDNLFIIGTVNIDETTYMFSPKVLDRSGVIEFRVSAEEMKIFLENFDSSAGTDLETIEGQGASMASDFLDQSSREATFSFNNDDKRDIINELEKFFKELKIMGAEFGYRTANDIFVYASKIRLLEESEGAEKWSFNQIIDTAIMQKLLPKLHGARRKICPVLKALAELCVTTDTLKKNVEGEVFYKKDFNFKNTKDVKYPLSLEKICRMFICAVDAGFASFAEN
jgi:energy-coupling factor transporter ATP-binding protein EcfA2